MHKPFFFAHPLSFTSKWCRNIIGLIVYYSRFFKPLISFPMAWQHSLLHFTQVIPLPFFHKASSLRHRTCTSLLLSPAPLGFSIIHMVSAYVSTPMHLPLITLFSLFGTPYSKIGASCQPSLCLMKGNLFITTLVEAKLDNVRESSRYRLRRFDSLAYKDAVSTQRWDGA